MSTPQNARKRADRARSGRKGRHRRAFDLFATELRRGVTAGRVLDVGALLDVELTQLRGFADELDRLEADPTRSSQTYAVLSRTYADLRRQLVADLTPPQHDDADDPLDRLIAELTADDPTMTP